MKKLALTTAAILAASPAFAGEFIVGIGQDDVFDQTGTEAAAVVFEYHADPFYEGNRASYGLAGAAFTDEDGDVFLGAGIAAIWKIGSGRWFVEGSLMPGYYDSGSGGSNLGGNLQFRTVLGLAYRLESGGRISFAFEHKSNADIEDNNPGSEMLMVRYGFAF